MGIVGEESALEPSLRRNADFVRLWTGGAVSGLGSAISGLAYPLLALSVTTSAGLAGLLGLVALAAGSLTHLPAGAFADRVPLRRVLVALNPQPVIAGVLIGCIYFTFAPANAVLLAAQIHRAPTQLQGRVIAAAFLISGLVAPLGTPSGGVLLDTAGPAITFCIFAGTTAAITLAVHLNRAMRDNPGADQ